MPVGPQPSKPPRTRDPELTNSNLATCTPEPEPPTLNRQQRRRLAALARKRSAA